jgi:hypothetical protein
MRGAAACVCAPHRRSRRCGRAARPQFARHTARLNQAPRGRGCCAEALIRTAPAAGRALRPPPLGGRRRPPRARTQPPLCRSQGRAGGTHLPQHALGILKAVQDVRYALQGNLGVRCLEPGRVWPTRRASLRVRAAVPAAAAVAMRRPQQRSVRRACGARAGAGRMRLVRTPRRTAPTRGAARRSWFSVSTARATCSWFSVSTARATWLKDPSPRSLSSL